MGASNPLGKFTIPPPKCIQQSPIQPIKLSQPLHYFNDLLIRTIGGSSGSTGTATVGAINSRSQHIIQHHTQAGNKDTNTSPATQAKPAVDDQTTACSVEGNRTAEEEKGVNVECWGRLLESGSFRCQMEFTYELSHA